MDIINMFHDTYDRKARLYPVLLTLGAPTAVLMMIVPAVLQHYGTIISIAVASGALMFLSNMGREHGKSIEQALFSGWGGTPTTQSLMYKSTSLDAVTLERYRGTLEGCIPNLKFLDKNQESVDPVKAAEICQSAIRWLREATRDKSIFPIVFAENVNYGFRRNLLGLRPIAILLCYASFIFLELLGRVSTIAIAGASMMELILLVAALIWLILVNEKFVKTAAFAYATALLLSCDSSLLKK